MPLWDLRKILWEEKPCCAILGAAGAESIAEALHACGAHRIGHGTRLYEDPELLDYVNDHQVPIEVCLTSNVQTHAVESSWIRWPS